MLPFLYFTNAISITLFRNRHKRKHRNITIFAARWGRCPLGHKDGHQGFHPCESRFLYFLVWRRSESGDRFEIGERQRIFTSVSFSTCSQCQIPYCYTYRLLCAGAAQGELPEGQEKVSWGIPVSRNSFVWILRTAPTDFTYPSTPTSYLAEPLTLTPTKKENPPGFSFFITPYP